MKFTYPSGARPLEGYTIKRGVGRGGFGEVYYATSDAGKEVALKLIRRNLDVEVRGVSHCLNLKHPNLLSVFDLKRDDQDDTWVVMEYVAGECLEDVLARSPQGMPPEDALAWMHGILAGVGYLHDHGIVHRDLKPGNIFSDEAVVKIGDYGLSKFISCSRRSGQTESVGTVHYMAPEVANGRYGKEIDIYALGVIFYEMLTGNVPFEGESVGEVLMKHLTAEPDLSQLKDPFRTVVARCLAKDPTQRVNTVQELSALLPPPARHMHYASLPPAPRPAVAGPALPPPPLPGAASPVAGNEEPVWKAVRGGAGQVQDAWRQANLNPVARAVVIVAGIVLALNFAGPLAAVAVTLLSIYGVYFIGRLILFTFVKPSAAPMVSNVAVPMAALVPAPSSPAPAAHKSPADKDKGSRRGPRRRWGQSTLMALPPKSGREKTSELLASMLFAPAIVGVVVLVASLLQGQIGEPNQYAWLMIVSTLAAWGVMIPAKLWEGQKKEDAMLRRFTMLAVGLTVGLIAFGAQRALLVDLPAASGAYPRGQSPLYHWSSMAQGLTGYLAYFGFLFLVPRWWKSADPGRRHRLELWSTAAVVFWSWVVGMFWTFPQPWGLMVAAGSCVAVQLASPWVDPRTRRQATTA